MLIPIYQLVEGALAHIALLTFYNNLLSFIFRCPQLINVETRLYKDHYFWSQNGICTFITISIVKRFPPASRLALIISLIYVEGAFKLKYPRNFEYHSSRIKGFTAIYEFVNSVERNQASITDFWLFFLCVLKMHGIWMLSVLPDRD